MPTASQLCPNINAGHTEPITPCAASGNLRIWREYDQATQKLIAFHTHLLAWDSERTIYLDGRPHPPEYADHTWQGFSTGVWEGNMLTITTTHLKTNYIRRNGVPRSDKATLTEHWYRHGDYLTVVTVINDPVFLTEPLVRSDNWFLDPGQAIGVFGCEYAPEVPRPPGTVPHHLPGTNQFLTSSPIGTACPMKLPEAVRRHCIRSTEQSWAITSRPRSASATVPARRCSIAT